MSALTRNMVTSVKSIDGSILEGGGQILRNSISFSALLGVPVRIHDIRKGRKGGAGLKNQHRTGLELVSRISSSSTLTGAVNGALEISFTPGQINLPANFEADSVTAGSTTLLLQISFPLFLFSPNSGPSTLIVKGGTNATQAPQVDYTQRIFLPFVKQHFGVHSETKIDIERRGYFPKGGGKVAVTVHPTPGTGKLRPITLLDPGHVVAIRGIAHFAGLPSKVGQSMVQGAHRILEAAGFPISPTSTTAHVPIEIECKRESNDNTVGAGSGIVLWAELSSGGILGGSAVGSKGKEPSDVGAAAAAELVKAIKGQGCVDEWLQDQVVIFMALADGFSQLRCGKGDLTLHTLTAIHIASQLTSATFEVKDEDDGHKVISCKGIGYSAVG